MYAAIKAGGFFITTLLKTAGYMGNLLIEAWDLLSSFVWPGSHKSEAAVNTADDIVTAKERGDSASGDEGDSEGMRYENEKEDANDIELPMSQLLSTSTSLLSAAEMYTLAQEYNNLGEGQRSELQHFEASVTNKMRPTADTAKYDADDEDDGVAAINYILASEALLTDEEEYVDAQTDFGSDGENDDGDDFYEWDDSITSSDTASPVPFEMDADFDAEEVGTLGTISQYDLAKVIALCGCQVNNKVQYNGYSFNAATGQAIFVEDEDSTTNYPALSGRCGDANELWLNDGWGMNTVIEC